MQQARLPYMQLKGVSMQPKMQSARLAQRTSTLGVTIADKIRQYEVIAQKRDADGAMIDRALDIVRKFIIDRKLILFGGLAIDYALRLKGDSIYPDDQRPDFDFMSSQNVDDAYDLTEILQKIGFTKVCAIRGIHVQTMKVRTDFIWVADIGYAPADVLSKIPTFDYHGMRVVHPDYQRMDMHLAFCFPFSGAPREDVFHRWRKDLLRFNLFEKYYPVDSSESWNGSSHKVTGKVLSLDKVALHGFAAYAALRILYDALAGTVAISAPHLSITIDDAVSVPTGAHTISVDTPTGDTIVLASPWPTEAVSDAKQFDPYMDIYPETYHIDNVIVFSTHGRKLAASMCDIAGKQIHVVTVHYLLLWFLAEYHQSTDENDRKIYRSFYAHTLEIIRAATALFPCVCDLMNSPFAPVITTFGDLNQDAAYIIKIASLAERLRDKPPEMLALDANIAELLVGLPTNYYPATKPRPTFSYDVSPLFRRSGQARDTPA